MQGRLKPLTFLSPFITTQKNFFTTMGTIQIKKVKKTVTTGKQGEVPEGEGSGSGSNENQNQNENGGGSQSETVAAPSISGNTSFAESTQVSMSGPDGAEIRYTTDGSVPTAESTLYSAPFSLTATTTVKAIAIKNGVSSEVTAKTFTKSNGAGDDAE